MYMHQFHGYLVNMYFSTTNLSALILGQNRPEMQSQKSLIQLPLQGGWIGVGVPP